MTDPRAAAVEAAAKVMCRRDGEDWAKLDETCPIGVTREWYRSLAGAAVSEFEARMAEAGWVMVRDVTITAASDTPPEFIMGWNACRAAMLGRDDPPRADGEG